MSEENVENNKREVGLLDKTTPPAEGKQETTLDVVLENPNKSSKIESRIKASRFRGANLTIHDILSCIEVMNVMEQRHGFNEDEKSSVDALRARLTKFLNINVPENYDFKADREQTSKYAEEEYEKVKSGEYGTKKEHHKTGGAPYPM